MAMETFTCIHGNAPLHSYNLLCIYKTQEDGPCKLREPSSNHHGILVRCRPASHVRLLSLAALTSRDSVQGRRRRRRRHVARQRDGHGL
jgi:hypothetical protein